VTEHTDAAAEEDAGEIFERTSILGVPDELQAREDFGGWTAKTVRGSIEAVAEATGEDPKELLEFATDAAKRDVVGKKRAAERVEQDLEQMIHERLLPDDKTLEKVTRYEAHLSRLLLKSLHELEALQIRRSGGAAPLARIDVDGSFAAES
jgi:hypothetical protein